MVKKVKSFAFWCGRESIYIYMYSDYARAGRTDALGTDGRGRMGRTDALGRTDGRDRQQIKLTKLIGTYKQETI